MRRGRQRCAVGAGAGLDGVGGARGAARPLSAVPTAAITAATPATASHRPPRTVDSRDARAAPGTSGASAAGGPPASSARTAGQPLPVQTTRRSRFRAARRSVPRTPRKPTWVTTSRQPPATGSSVPRHQRLELFRAPPHHQLARRVDVGDLGERGRVEAGEGRLAGRRAQPEGGADARADVGLDEPPRQQRRLGERAPDELDRVVEVHLGADFGHCATLWRQITPRRHPKGSRHALRAAAGDLADLPVGVALGEVLPLVVALLPRASPSSTLAQPSEKYSDSGTSVRPLSGACRSAGRSRSG